MVDYIRTLIPIYDYADKCFDELEKEFKLDLWLSNLCAMLYKVYQVYRLTWYGPRL